MGSRYGLRRGSGRRRKAFTPSTLVYAMPSAGRRDGAGRAATLRFMKKSALGLFFLAPLIGEYLLGNVTIRDIGGLVLLAPLYGGGALLIREVVRRTGKGWPTILALGLAYGLLEAGVFDGSLFSANYEGVDYDAVRIPVLDVSAFYGLQFVINHAAWSIGIPILLTETLTRRHRTTPWLGRIGLTVTVLVYLAAGLLIRSDTARSGEYHVSWARGAGVVLIAVLLIAIALTLPGPSPRESTRWVPRPWLVGVAAFVLSSAYFVLPATWRGVLLTIKIVLLTAWLVSRLSRRAGWQTRHQVALAAGALVTYAWAGFLITNLKHDNDRVAFAGNGVFTLAALALIVVALRERTGVTGATQEVESSRKA
jgi:sulfite exporter TauE/SafE